MSYAHNANDRPIHANGAEQPHATMRSAEGTYHLPYLGQTTLPMYGVGGPGESLSHIKQHGLGGLDAGNGMNFTPKW